MTSTTDLGSTEPDTSQDAPVLRTLRFGEAVPLCTTATRSSDRFDFDALGGRFVLVGFLPTAGTMDHATMMGAIPKAISIHNPATHVVGLATNADDSRTDPVLLNADGSILVFHDQGNGLHDAFGVSGAKRTSDGKTMQAGWFLLDPTLRVMTGYPPDQTDQALSAFSNLGAPLDHARVATPAPVMIVPRVFEPGFCKALLDYYAKRQQNSPGEGNLGANQVDAATMRRTDCMVEDEQLRRAAMHRVYWRLAPQVSKAYQLNITRLERHMIGCYDAAEVGYFGPHRDNTKPETAHRRFAASINLNDGYEGGGITFPEFSEAIYSPPPGGALVFSCSILHETLPITSGQRFAYLPYLYDDASAQMRHARTMAA